MTHEQTDPDAPRPQEAAWHQFRDLLARISAVSPMPFRVETADGETVFSSTTDPEEAGLTLLTMECRHGGGVLFRTTASLPPDRGTETLALMELIRAAGLQVLAGDTGRQSLYQEINRSYRFLHFFYSLPALLSRDVPRERLCQVGLERICKIARAERGSIFLQHAPARELRLAAWHGAPLSDPESARMNRRILDWIRERARPLLVEDVDRHPEFRGRGRYKTRTFVCAPVFYHPAIPDRGLAGLINLADPVDRPYFTSHDLKFVAAAAGYALFLAMTKPETPPAQRPRRRPV